MRCRNAVRIRAIEGFVYVIVSTEVQRFDFFCFALTRRQHNNGEVGPFARPPDDVFAITIGQAEIE